ncbi:MFS transporter [Streptomyces sp. NPDC058372]|uniref:MFS transporter n=1 Tax=unclassified Streptomyces TaxID=2593676 RepID=UPI00365AE450
MSAGGVPPVDKGGVADAAPGAGPGELKVGAVVGVLVLFELMSGFLQTGITPLLPALGDHHGVSDSALNWVISVQLLSGAVLVPVFGRLGDLRGRRLMLRIALVCVAAGSVLVALAPNFTVLLLGRVLQGALVALLPLEIALVRDRLPVDRARSAIARLVGALTLGSLIGAVVMGAVAKAVDDLTVVLLLPAVFALVCVPVSMRWVPETRARAGGSADWPGMVLLGLTLLALLGGVSRAEEGSWLSAAVLGPLLVSVVLGVCWVRWELGRAEPLVDLRAMRGRRVAPFYLVSFFFGVMYFGSQSPNTTFLAADPAETGYGFGLSALEIALVTLPATVAALLTSSGTALIARRLGYRGTLALSFALMTTGFLALAAAHGSATQVVVALLVCGTGIGAALSAMPTVIVEATDPARTGVASALYNNVKTVGGAVAGGAAASVLGAFTPAGSHTPGESGYLVLWLVCAVCGLGAVAGVAVARRSEGTGADGPAAPVASAIQAESAR